jgi:hypothetical protein
MKKIILSAAILGLLLGRATAQNSQTPTNTKVENSGQTSEFKKRSLKLEEVNFVQSYYTQDGNNSAITGGKGTEKLTDYATSVDFKLKMVDAKKRIHNFNLDLNIDYYTSASQANIDPGNSYESSASKDDTHFYPSASYSVTNEATGVTKGINYSYSTEWDYRSNGLSFNWAKAFNDNNTEITAKVGVFMDKYDVILPSEMRPLNYGSGAGGDPTPIDTKPRNTYNLSLGFSQVINERLQVSAVFEPSAQEGLLSTPFNRVIFSDSSRTTERLPYQRLKFPLGLRANLFLGDRWVLRTHGRFYADNWGMESYTGSMETVFKFTPFVSLSPFYRFNYQTGVDYFKPYGKHNSADKYYTSDYDLSEFSSHFVGMGLRLSPPNGIVTKHINSVELRYGYYGRSNNLDAHIISLNFTMK